MPRARKSPYWRTCPECGQQTYDRNYLKPGRKFYRCPNGHVWHPDPAKDIPKNTKEKEPQVKKSWFDRLMGE